MRIGAEREPSGPYAACGRLIRVERTRVGLGVERAAGAVGVAPSYLSMVEAGKKPPSKRVVEKLSDAFRLVASARQSFLAAVARERFLVDLRKLVGEDRARQAWVREYVSDLAMQGEPRR